MLKKLVKAHISRIKSHLHSVSVMLVLMFSLMLLSLVPLVRWAIFDVRLTTATALFEMSVALLMACCSAWIRRKESALDREIESVGSEIAVLEKKAEVDELHRLWEL